MEIVLKGPGTIAVSLIDRQGKTRIHQELVLSGSNVIWGRINVPLIVRTTRGEVPVAPVLTQQSNAVQVVTFDAQEPFAFTKTRCKGIGCSRAVARNAELGHVASIRVDHIRAAGVMRRRA
jgi:hypothetical protein